MAAGAGMGGVAAYWLSEVIRHALVYDPRGDFATFLHAGRDVLSGTSPYAISTFFSPPWFAVAMSPLATLPPELSQVTWTLITIFSVALCGVLVWKMAGWGKAEALPLLVSALMLSLFYPLRQLLDSAQTDAFALLATTLFVYCDTQGRQFLSGLSLTIGLIDPHLILGPCIYALAHGRWKAVAGGACGGAACAILSAFAVGPSSLVVFLMRLRAAEAWWVGRPFQTTVLTTLAGAGMPRAIAWAAFGALAAVAVVAGVLALLRHADDPLASLAVTAALSTFLLPFGFAQDYSLMLLALPWACRSVREGRAHPWLASAVLLYFGGLTWARYPISHDALHTLMPLALFPALWLWHDKLGFSRSTAVAILISWAVGDIIFGLGNPLLPTWVDSLGFNMGAASVLIAGTAWRPIPDSALAPTAASASDQRVIV